MKQILQSLKNGRIEITSVPSPALKPGHLLVRSCSSLISAGTERILLEFGKANFVEKARQQPDKVRMVLDKIKTDGLMPAFEAVLNKLDQPLPMGYSNAGIVQDIASDVTGFSHGDRVVSNGKHAELVAVPANLCAKIPVNIPTDQAAFAVVGAIALQGIRLAKPTLGETVVVTGLGLVGLIAVQLLRANGCRVLGIDLDAARISVAREFGVEVVNVAAGEDPVSAAWTFSRGRGVDAVIVALSTQDNEPLHQAALMCRKRGRIVLVGVAGLELSRTDFYEKELSFQVSCSYGPGRYDPNYEEKGRDYPIGFVRWTAQRNFEAILDMMADGSLNVKPLISHRFAIDQAEKAYQVLAGHEPSLGILLEYPVIDKGRKEALHNRTVYLSELPSTDHKKVNTDAVLGFVGAGNYATSTLIPAFKVSGARLKVVASISGLSGVHAGRKFGFERATTDTKGVFDDPQIDAVVVTTRHDSHARLVCEALRTRKHVFVEKPLALTLDELTDIENAYCNNTFSAILMVGFNRRFAPQIKKVRSLLERTNSPKVFIVTVNAGRVPTDHWVCDPKIGGGRIIGEACHFIDLLRFLAGAKIISYGTTCLDSQDQDTVTIQLAFADGSIGTIHYLTNGNKKFGKERLEIFSSGRILQLDNFRSLRGYGWPGFKKMHLWRQDKGQLACAQAFVQAISNNLTSPIPIDELIEVSRISVLLSQPNGSQPQES